LACGPSSVRSRARGSGWRALGCASRWRGRWPGSSVGLRSSVPPDYAAGALIRKLWSPETRRRTLWWTLGVVLTIGLVAASPVLMGGSPPSKIILATGQPGGVYDSFGHEYQKRLGAQGLKVELVNTAGSVDNFRRIIEGKVDVAFAQSGTYQAVT